MPARRESTVTREPASLQTRVAARSKGRERLHNNPGARRAVVAKRVEAAMASASAIGGLGPPKGERAEQAQRDPQLRQ